MSEQPKRMSLSQVVERLTEKRSAASSCTVKMSAQGVLMPDVTVVSGEDDETIETMKRQAIDTFVSIMQEAFPSIPAPGVGPSSERAKKKDAPRENGEATT